MVLPQEFFQVIDIKVFRIEFMIALVTLGNRHIPPPAAVDRKSLLTGLAIGITFNGTTKGLAGGLGACCNTGSEAIGKHQISLTNFRRQKTISSAHHSKF